MSQKRESLSCFTHYAAKKIFSHQARELAGPGLRSDLITMRSNISSLEEAFLSISSILERVVRRSVEETQDLAGMSRELASLSNNTVFSLLDDEAEFTTHQDRDFSTLL